MVQTHGQAPLSAEQILGKCDEQLNRISNGSYRASFLIKLPYSADTLRSEGTVAFEKDIMPANALHYKYDIRFDDDAQEIIFDGSRQVRIDNKDSVALTGEDSIPLRETGVGFGLLHKPLMMHDYFKRMMATEPVDSVAVDSVAPEFYHVTVFFKDDAEKGISHSYAVYTIRRSDFIPVTYQFVARLNGMKQYSALTTDSLHFNDSKIKVEADLQKLSKYYSVKEKMH